MAEKVDIYMPLYIADYLADTTHFSAAQHGAYLKLIMAYWRNGGPLEFDEEALQRTSSMTESEWKKQSKPVLKLFEVRDNLLHHKRIDKELKSAIENRARLSARGRLAAEKKKHKHSKSATQDQPQVNHKCTSSTTTSAPQGELDDNPSPSPSPSPGEEESPPNPPAEPPRLCPHFEKFRSLYPNKAEWDLAEKEWGKLPPFPEFYAQVLEGLEWWVRSDQWVSDRGQFVPFAWRWLSKSKWVERPALHRLKPKSPSKDDLLASYAADVYGDPHESGPSDQRRETFVLVGTGADAGDRREALPPPAA